MTMADIALSNFILGSFQSRIVTNTSHAKYYDERFGRIWKRSRLQRDESLALPQIEGTHQ
jgi:hypothetical protein